MKKIILAAGIFLFGLSVSAQTVIGVDTITINSKGLEKVLVEKISPSAAAIAAGVPSGSVTYRIYADMMEDYQFLACSGLDNTTPLTYITIRSTEAFFNETSFGALSFISFIISIIFDSES